MPDKKPHEDKNLKPDGKDVIEVDQAEGERDSVSSSKVNRTPGQAEGERNPADQNKQ